MSPATVKAECLDWVEIVTGERGPSWCERNGHDWKRTGEIRIVNGHPAAHHECRACGHLGFIWIKGEEA